jgi:hypothetical protein
MRIKKVLCLNAYFIKTSFLWKLVEGARLLPCVLRRDMAGVLDFGRPPEKSFVFAATTLAVARLFAILDSGQPQLGVIRPALARFLNSFAEPTAFRQ